MPHRSTPRVAADEQPEVGRTGSAMVKRVAKAKGKTRKAGRGRPTDYDPERHVRIAHQLALLGLTNDEMEPVLGIGHGTFVRWLKRHAEFRSAVKDGREAADARVGQRLYERAMGYSHPAVKILQYEGAPVIVPYTEHYAPDTAACIFWLKNRQRQQGRWRDRVNTELSGPDSGPVEANLHMTASPSLEAATAAIKAILAKTPAAGGAK